MSACPTCQGQRWVCENHPFQPWGEDGCDLCGGAGSPCADCNTPPDGSFPAMPPFAGIVETIQ